jgi:hypothetical protein
MFVSISNYSKPEQRIYQISLLCALMLLVAAVCAPAQTASVRSETGYSSALGYTPFAPGQPPPAVLTGSALPQPVLYTFEPSPALPQSGFDANPSKQSADPDFHKYTFETGLGANLPAGRSTGTYQSTGFAIQAGFGRNLNSRYGAQLEYNVNFFGIPSSVLNNVCNACSSGNVIVQSVSVNPFVNLNPRSKVGLYVIGGAGYYWKDTRFLVPSGMEYCGIDGCVPTETCGYCTTGGAFGVNGGGGINWRLGSVSSLKLFAEGRYVWVNSQTGSNNASTYYPPANYRASFIPALIGIRW